MSPALVRGSTGCIVRQNIFALSLVLGSTSAIAATQDGYHFGVSDRVHVDVAFEGELSRDYTIGPNCQIEVALIGRVAVCERTAGAVAEEIQTRLADGYLVAPQVTVGVLEYASQFVQVKGQVSRPGLIMLKGPTTLSQVVTEAGGPAAENVGEVEVIRDGKAPVLVDLMDDEGLSSVFVQGGDIVHLRQGRHAYVHGEVKEEGAVPFRDGLTVTQALALAGGPGEYARLGRAHLVRSDGEKTRVNLRRIIEGREADLLLHPDDKLILKRSAF